MGWKVTLPGEVRKDENNRVTVGTHDDNQQESHQGLGRRAAWVFCEESDPEAFPGHSGARLRWNVAPPDVRACPKTEAGGQVGEAGPALSHELELSLEDPAVPPIACPGLLPMESAGFTLGRLPVLSPPGETASGFAPFL